MNEIKVGEYVRTKYGIAQIIDIENYNGTEVIVFDKDIVFLVDKKTGKIKDDILLNQLAVTENIDLSKLRHSKNIIDLIEEGDYVNRLLVHGISDFGVEVYMYGDAPVSLTNEEIETIVTKEQFKEMEYRL